MKFTKLKWRNLFSYGDYDNEIALNQNGIVFIRGVNAVDSSSNGSGKSSIIDIFVWILYGKTLKDIPVDNIKCLYTNSPGWGCVEFWYMDEYYEINRYRGDKEFGNGVHIKKNGIIDERFLTGTNRDVQNQIDGLIGLDYSAFVSSVIFSSETPFKIPRLTADKRRAHLETILGLQAYSEYGRIAKNRAKNIRRILDDLVIEEREKKVILESQKVDLETYSKKLKNYKSEKLTELKKLEESFNEINSKIEAIDITRRERLVQEITLKESNLSKLRIDIGDIKAKIATLQGEEKTIKSEIESIKREYNTKLLAIDKEAKTTIKSLRNKIELIQKECPTCQRGWDAVHVEIYTNTYEKKIQTVEDSLKTNLANLNKERDRIIDTYSQKLTNILQRTEEAQKDYELLKNNLTILESELEINNNELKTLPTQTDLIMLQDKLARIQKDIDVKNNEQNPYEDVIDNIQIKISDYLDQLDKIDEKKNDAEEKLKYAIFWDESFNNDGLKLFIFESIIPLLNQRIAYYLPLLFDGKDVRIFFDKMMNMFTISNGQPTAYGALSQGERKRVDLAIALALLDIARSKHGIVGNVMFFDEIFDSSLDSQGVRTVMEILYSMPVATIFIISHRLEIAQEFDRVIDIEKNNKFSYILS